MFRYQIATSSLFNRIFLFSMRNYTLGQPRWSLKELNLQSQTQQDDETAYLVSSEQIHHLAKLACIDLNAAILSSNPFKQQPLTLGEICHDVNVILKCAQSLQVCAFSLILLIV